MNNSKYVKSYDNYLDLSDIKNNSEYTKLEEIANIIKNGGIVIFPTETVYGIGANGFDEEAVKKIFLAKGRAQDNPLILHISDIEMLGKISNDISDIEFSLMNAFWPGPFTIILNKSANVPYIVSGGVETVGVRMPNNEIARNLIKYSDVPIAAPSANISGKPSGTNIEDIFNELSDKVNYIIDGGDCNIGIESTVVRVIDGVPHILRPGYITAEQIKEVAGSVVIDSHVLGKLSDDKKVLSPGMKYKHYAPNTKCVLVYDENDDVRRNKIVNLINNNLLANKKLLLMCKTSSVGFFNNKFNSIDIIDMGDSLVEISKNIFKDLRDADSHECDLIIIEGVETSGLGLAIMNRLLRACNYDIY